MKLIKLMLSLLCAVAMLLMAAGCSTVPANTVFSADDIPGKTIGVQLGTTGDIVYASDYETDGETKENQRCGAGAQAGQTGLHHP